MNEIAETAPNATLPTIQSTTRLAEIRNGRELAVDRPCGVPAGIQRIASFLRRVFVFESCVDIADEMIIIIITNDNLFNFPKLAHLAPEVLVESVEVVLQLAGVHLDLRVVGGVLVQVGEQNRLAVGGLDVFA